MKVLFYTFYMLSGTERLMPWRTLLEVARWMNSTGRYQAAICSAQEEGETRLFDGVTIFSIGLSMESLNRMVIEGQWDIVFYPITYRQGLKSMRSLSEISAEVIVYVPGGLSPLSGAFRLMCDGYGKIAKPYLLDTITPHGWIIKKLHKSGVRKIIAQAPLTIQDAVNNGWDKEMAFCALPGKDINVTPDESLVCKLGLKGIKFLLFSGAPAPIRGALMALRAFDAIAEKIPGIKLVMLMRRDISSDFSEMEAAIKKIKHENQIEVCYDRVNREELFGMFRAAWAVLLPFLIVPSEIPLTFFEVMGLGTPVITFENGGTTDYLYPGLKVAKYRTRKSLGNAILSICQSEENRNRLSQRAKEIMDNHPTWEQTAEIWAKAIEEPSA